MLDMSEYKFSFLLVILILSSFAAGWFLERGLTEDEESYSVTILNERGDTLLQISSSEPPSLSSSLRVENQEGRIKIWVEEGNVLDVWVNHEEGGWTRK